ncbi:MAG: redox-regulated ATPase YchF, partial [Cytophagales bacterium]|nr:redox-regulated ATPase YchF [Cytophagales bacterium]
MALQCGIVGLPNVGKSTLFNALSNAKAEAANYPFCTIEPNVGIVSVPDVRLNELAKLVNPERVLPTTFEFVDIAGLVKGASKGEGLGNQFLANIRQVDAIAHVVRCFEDDNVVHVAGKVDPVADKDIIDTELQIRDLDSIDKKIAKVERAAKAGDAKAKKDLEILHTYKNHLESGRNARELEISKEDAQAVEDLQLLTGKPVIYVANVDEKSIHSGNANVEKLKAAVKNEKAEVIIVCANLESQIAEITDPEDKQMFLDEYKLTQSGLDQLIRAAYSMLNLITYFTAGVQEVRAWTIEKGWKAPKAAGVIHTDFEKGFIKAEVIQYANYLQYKSEAACKEAGKLSIEGKDYIVQ